MKRFQIISFYKHWYIVATYIMSDQKSTILKYIFLCEKLFNLYEQLCDTVLGMFYLRIQTIKLLLRLIS